MTTGKLAGLITLLLFLCASFNFLGARWYGESEFCAWPILTVNFLQLLILHILSSQGSP